VSLAWVSVILCPVSGAQAIDNDPYELRSSTSARRPGLSILDIGLPLDFRARIAGLYTRSLHAVDGLAFDPLRRVGPAIRRYSLLESRVSIARRVWDGVELEVAWALQSPLSMSATPSMGRQTFGAFIRFVH
jgi:hypothetical protein